MQNPGLHPGFCDLLCFKFVLRCAFYPYESDVKIPIICGIIREYRRRKIIISEGRDNEDFNIWRVWFFG